MKKKIGTLILIVLMLGYLTAPAPILAAAQPIIKVALKIDASSYSDKIYGPYQVVDNKTGAVVATVNNSDGVQVDVSPDNGGDIYVLNGEGAVTTLPADSTGLYGVGAGGTVQALPKDYFMVDAQAKPRAAKGLALTVDGTPAGTFVGPLEFQRQSTQLNNPPLIGFNGKRYRGNFRLIPRSETAFNIINVLPMEEYLYGVVPSEMPTSWHMEALKAQAVAARTYALRQIKANPLAEYNVLPTDASQVYGGYDKERGSSSSAVDQTRGEVLVYNGQPIDAVFHSSNGGATENSEEVWSSTVAYLRGKVDPFDYNDWHYRSDPKNTVTYDKAGLITQLNLKGYNFGDVTDLIVDKLTTVGQRIQILRITGKDKNGNSLEVILKNADRVRTTFGLKARAKSMTLVKDPVTQELQSVTFTSEGWGHGLGMSQYGAKGRAENGQTYKQILQFYYTGAQLVGDYNQSQ
ncbi:SpoIID/LytB domain-containing protein [Carboxydocella sp. JDF658]|uniref:SpoIID/LytB domain-containing protein n=1 Tax=Carboxydocella sp. JDF658 TaxID=1926600 RepID=UPI0009AEA5B2|nr:SpoIID/LytB domain-containing protein [Carboxydocella sp. JDF658]GAW32603.1 stage II sporulation protein SpoIID [Carboxydocella sp. JDF658]